MNVNVGEKAPLFTVPVSAHKTVTLNDYTGQKLLLFFYPQDDTPGCTLESCAFRDAYEKLQAKGVQILGISLDSLESHEKFKQKYALPYDLGSDESGAMYRQFGILKDEAEKISSSNTRRSTFLIDESGHILKKWLDVNVNGHMKDIWESLGEDYSTTNHG